MTQHSMVRLDRVSTTLAGTQVMKDISLDVDSGEFFSIIGPSGCGKTTTLRVLGGFLIPDTGTVHLNGTDVTEVPPYRREVNTVFQSYALFAHMTVAENVAYGLHRKRVDKAEVRRRVGDMLDLVDLSARADAKPQDLSGGQRQRVALVRALVNLPKLLLLDEPLGALDLNLRRQMQEELKRVQREVGVSFVYVTHDQEEALSMSDRLAVMDHGVVQQVGSPREVYERPANTFVARFVGASNIVRVGEEAYSVRPERILITTPGASDAAAAGRIRGTVGDVSYLGAEVHYTVETVDQGPLKVKESCRFDAELSLRRPGEEVELSWHPDFAVPLGS